MPRRIAWRPAWSTAATVIFPRERDWPAWFPDTRQRPAGVLDPEVLDAEPVAVRPRLATSQPARACRVGRTPRINNCRRSGAPEAAALSIQSDSAGQRGRREV